MSHNVIEEKLKNIEQKLKKKYRILVFPCGSEIGIEIFRSLKDSIHIELFGASSEDNHGKYLYKNYIGDLPYIDSFDFVEKLNLIVEENSIDFIYPAHDSVVLKLSELSAKLKCKIIGSPYDTCQICRSKSRTYDYFESIIRVPQQIDRLSSRINFPVFLKPDVGQGSKGTYLANSQEEINFYLQKDPTLLILEYLPGKEYTIDCFTDRQGTVKFIGARERVRTMNGISVNTRPVIDERFNEIAKKINDSLVFRGSWFYQLKESEDSQLTLLEIAPRIAGSMALYRNLGVNFALLSIFDGLDIDTKVLVNKYAIEMDRCLTNRFQLSLTYDTVYIDLDDTIIYNSQINPMVMMFLFQCINEQKKINLITRHAGELNEILKFYRIENLFDSIILIADGTHKSKYINGESSIFIDDSFSERYQVSQSLGIPTFDVGMIESLIDWRNL